MDAEKVAEALNTSLKSEGYAIKVLPEDFKVVELFPELSLKESGMYSYWKLWKRNLTSLDALQVLADFLKVPVSRFAFAGQKDKFAVTEQTISAFNIPVQILAEFSSPDVAVSFVGYADVPVYLGQLLSNSFEIVVRNVQARPKLLKRFVNFFGEQRFSDDNSAVGKAFVKGNLEVASLIVAKSNSFVGEHLALHPRDFVGALRLVDKRLLRLYVHAYQSSLWNRGVELFLQSAPDYRGSFPLVGFGTELENTPYESVVNGLLSDEGITLRSFVISSLPDISSEGDLRDVFVEFSDLDISRLSSDELHDGAKRCTLKFTLPKGCYATEVVRQLFEKHE